MMIKKKIMFVERNLGNMLESWCMEPPTDCGKGEVLFDQEVVFGDGNRMAIQAIASLEPSNEPIWTQGVLFAANGEEIGFTEPSDSFWGEYQVDDYVVDVHAER